MNNYSEFLNKLISMLKEKVYNNTTYYIVLNDFSKDGFNIYEGATILPSILGGNTDDVVLSVIYKVKPIASDISIIDAGEGIIKMTYVDLASLLIAKKIVAYYTDEEKADTEISNILDEIKNRIPDQHKIL